MENWQETQSCHLPPNAVTIQKKKAGSNTSTTDQKGKKCQERSGACEVGGQKWKKATVTERVEHNELNRVKSR